MGSAADPSLSRLHIPSALSTGDFMNMFVDFLCVQWETVHKMQFQNFTVSFSRNRAVQSKNL